jgi:surface carbohydrate biosynthesis protein (TIGR04326 family)
MTEVVTVWDGDKPAEHVSGRSLLWSSYAALDGSISIPAYLDANGLRLRQKYVTFVHELGASVVEHRSLVEHFATADGMSLWWMSQLAEKSPFKSPDLYACLRLLALEELLRKDLPHGVKVVSSNRKLLESIARMCENLGIEVSTGRAPVSVHIPTAKLLYQLMPWRIRGLLSLRHSLRRWPARQLRAAKWHVGPQSIFFASYFFNLDQAQAAEGRFHSHQWEALPGHLESRGMRLNWLHHLLLSPGIRKVRTAVDIAKRINSNPVGTGVHAFVESFLSTGLIGAALAEWWRVGRLANRLRSGASFRPKGSHVDLWPMLKDDWNTSFLGPAGLANGITRRLIDRCLHEIPRQNQGFYLWENQGWEAAFLHSWRRCGHGDITGVPHATVAFWHLNNFDAPPTFLEQSPGCKPLPDRLAVNGGAARSMLMESGYPVERLVDAEALRFQYLSRLQPANSPVDQDLNSPIRLLLLGDFTRRQTLAMASCLALAIAQSRRAVQVTYKPHPVCDVDIGELGVAAYAVNRQPLFEILNQFEWAFSSNSSSAGLDAFLGGLRVAVFLDDASLNHSPLRGEPGVLFVNDHRALSRALDDRQLPARASADKYFWLDPELPRWTRLLLTDAVPAATACE